MPGTKSKPRRRFKKIFNLFSTKKSPTTKRQSNKPKQSRYTLKKSVSSPKTKNKIKTMDNSIEILNIIRDSVSVSSSLSTCPPKITKEMLAIELDCEDLRANIQNETQDSLWSAYREVNSHLFKDRKPPSEEDLRELKKLIDKFRIQNKPVGQTFLPFKNI